MTYTYLFFATSLFIIPWVIFFVLRPDLRKEIISASLFVGIAGLFCEKYWYIVDWVKPMTLTHTAVGIEDFIMGFCAGGSERLCSKK